MIDEEETIAAQSLRDAQRPKAPHNVEVEVMAALQRLNIQQKKNVMDFLGLKVKYGASIGDDVAEKNRQGLADYPASNKSSLQKIHDDAKKTSGRRH